MKSCIFEATPEFLAGILDLPREAVIDAVRDDPCRPGVLLFRIRGVGEEVAPGQLIPKVTPAVSTVRDESGLVVSRRVVWHDHRGCQRGDERSRMSLVTGVRMRGGRQSLVWSAR